MATNNSGIQPLCLQVKSEGKEKEEKGREQELTGEELAKRTSVENLWSIRDLFADSCS